MFYLNIIFALFLSLSYAVITVSPDGTQDFTTIQAAIDHVTANPADLEIDVYPGTYQENLLIEADMIIRSVGDADNTIIDGSLGNRSLGSTIVIRPESNTTHHPVVEIDGFSIKNGKGTDVVNKTITLTDGSHPEEKVGGGLFVYVNSPKVNNSQFLGNGDNSTDKGGAIFSVSYSDGIDFPDRPDYQDHSDLVPAEGTLDFSNNTFLGNDADYGHSVYILGDDYDEVKMIGDYLDVFSMNYESASEYWVVSDYDIDYTNASGEAEGILNDVWVDPINGTDESNISGDQNNPFLTIDYAMGMIYPTEDNPVTIHLTEGAFSPTLNGETFPIIMFSHLNLIGQGEELTIIDAEETNRVVTMEDCLTNIISDLTITGGLAANYGGGIYIGDFVDEVTISNLIIKENNSYLGGGIYIGTHWDGEPPIFLDSLTVSNNVAIYGGGIYIDSNNDLIIANSQIKYNAANHGGGVFIAGGNSKFIDVEISNNQAEYEGGGVSFLYFGNPIFEGVTIKENESFRGGGISYGYSDASSSNYNIVFSTDNRSNIYSNTAIIGNDIYADYMQMHNIIVDTFSVLIPNDFYISPIINFSYDILNGFREQVNDNLWVDPENGSDGNSGLSQNSALKTINFANSIIRVDENNQHSINLMSGIYSQYNNQEVFPIKPMSYVDYIGESVEEVVFNAYGMTSVIECTLVKNVKIANTTITGGVDGGINLFISSPIIENVNINNNNGAISIIYAHPIIRNTIIYNNIVDDNLGVIDIYTGSPLLQNVTIVNNYSPNGSAVAISLKVYSFPKIINSILLNEGIEINCLSAYECESCELLLSHSNLYSEQNEISGLSVENIYADMNISQDPQFTSPENDDFSLQEGSPCIGAGTAYFEWEGEIIVDIPESDYSGSAPDMGAFEFEGTSIQGDLNDDGVINVLDVVALVNIVLTGGDYNTAGDLNSDGVNNVLDVVFLVNIILNG